MFKWLSFLTWAGFTEMVLNGIIIGVFANIICPQVHRFVVWLFALWKGL